MSALSFLMRDKQRRKFFFMVLAIAVPILLISIYLVSSSETKAALAGVPNEEGGTTYYYRESSGAKDLPAPVTKILALYPGSEATNISISTDKSGVVDGFITAYTKDDIRQVLAFYKQSATVESETDHSLEAVKNGVHFRISKDNIYDDDPIKGQTKYEIRFLDGK